ncbi:MAG: DUF998 domain-containing protein [Patescibacteria group bacterium]
MRFSHDKSGLIGPLLWVSSIQYFIVQLVVIAAWTVPHSWANNFISDLGNTECGMYAGLPVCSPLHLLMNISFVTFGITMAIGAPYVQRQFERTKLSRLAFGLMMLSGLGTVLVGLFPENTINALHMTGAVLGLGVGNLSVLLLGIALKDVHPAVRAYTVVSGMFSLVAFALFATEVHFGIGRGGMERLISYPFTLWMITFGFYVTLVRIRARS